MPLLFFVLILTGAANAQYTIRTIAGDGPPDGSQAMAIPLGAPPAALATPSGDIYFPAPSRNKIFKLSPAGLITTVAGNGGSGFSGDGVPATAATLNNPTDVAMDSAGNLYIADTGNNRVRKVSTSGIISTIAGTGMMGYAGDGGPATNAWLWSPHSLKFDASGNLFIAEAFCIRKISPAGIIATVAGTGTYAYAADGEVAATSPLLGAASLALDEQGNIYFTEPPSHCVRKISANGILGTLAGNTVFAYSGDGGPARNASLWSPRGLARDTSGNIYIADRDNHRVRKVAPNGVITTAAGTGTPTYSGDGGPAINATLASPEGVATDIAGNLYVLEGSGGPLRIRKIDSTGIISTIAGNGTSGLFGDGGPATNAQLFGPQGIAVSPTGAVYVADAHNDRVRVISPDGKIATVAGGGISISEAQPATSALLAFPYGLALGSTGDLFIANTGQSTVRKVSPAGIITTVAGTALQRGSSGDGQSATRATLDSVWDVALDNAGAFYIADDARVRKVSSTGIITTVAGNGTRAFSGDGGQAVNASLSGATGVAVDRSGNLYIADSPNHRIRKVSITGMISTIAGNGETGFSGDDGPATNASLFFPSGIAVDSQGSLYVLDTGNNRIRKVLPNGIITTIAGDGTAGFSGDGSAAANAAINQVSRVALDASGNIYLSDSRNNRIRVLSPHLAAQPASLTVQYSRGASVPSAQTITVTSNPTRVTAEPVTNSPVPWLVVNKTGSAPHAFAVSIDPTAMLAGVHTGSIRLSSAGVATEIPVTLSVTDPQGCSYTLSPSSLGVPATISSATFRVNTNPGCSWTAATTVPWVTFTSAASGVLPGFVTLQIQPNAGLARTAVITVGDQSLSLTQSAAAAATTALRFVPVAPCRIIDTRPNAVFSGGEIRPVNVPSSPCNIPTSASAYALNVTVVPSGPLTYLSLWPYGQPQPLVSTLNSFDGRIKANAAIVPSGTNGAVNIFVTDASHVVLDINGYFTRDTGASFYPTPPCRITDTRPNATLGANQTRTINIAASPCNIPSTATAYSLNFTAVPQGPLGYLTTWPAGQPQPLVSTLNVPTGAITANAAIVPTGANGSINVFVTNPTDLVIDSNGYFAPSGQPNERTFYPVTPCRVIDTRLTTIMTAAETRAIHVPSSPCNIPATAKAYSLNATVVPTGPLAYLTLWPSDSAQPYVSTLNAFDGTVTSNAAIVPAASNGSINAFVTGTTHLILDINGYFQ